MCVCAHSEVLNAPLLPRSCAKCCFGCIPAIDRRLAAGGEMAAGRDCASFNEFIQLSPTQTACGYSISGSKESLSLLCLGPHGQSLLFATFHTTLLDLLPPALLLLWLLVQVLYLNTTGFIHLRNASPVLFPQSSFYYLPSVVFGQLLITFNNVQILVFALLEEHWRALARPGCGFVGQFGEVLWGHSLQWRLCSETASFFFCIHLCLKPKEMEKLLPLPTADWGGCWRDNQRITIMMINNDFQIYVHARPAAWLCGRIFF